MQRFGFSALPLLLILFLFGCIESKDRLLDERSALSDPYFEGAYSYELGGRTRNLLIKRTAKSYAVEEDGKPVGSATLHPFREGALLVQLRNPNPAEGAAAYVFLLVRKTPYGFDAGGSCKSGGASCKAATRTELLGKLQADAHLAAGQGNWVAVRRVPAAPVDQPALVSENPVDDCNGADRARKIAGCTAVIDGAGTRDADRALAFSRRSDAFLDARDFDRAIADRSEALKLQPDDFGYKMRLGAAYQLRAKIRVKTDRAGALADLAAAILADPSNFQARIERSSQLAAGNEIDKAVEEMEAAIRSDSRQQAAYSEWLVTLLTSRAVQRSLAADMAGAIADYGMAIKLRPADARLLVDRGNLHGARGDYGLAIADYTDALALKSDYADALLRRAEMYRRTAQPARSLSDLNAAVRLEGRNVNILLARGLVRESMEQYDDARADYARVIAIDPRNTIAKSGLDRATRQRDLVGQIRKLDEQANAAREEMSRPPAQE